MKNRNLKFWKNKNVLITGHNGFLGSWLTKILFELGARVTGIDIKNNQRGILKHLSKDIKDIRGDVSDFKLVNLAIDNSKPQIVFHLAAQAIVQEAVREPVRTFKSNIQGTWNILEACRDKEFVQAIVVASSDKAYGVHKKLPYKEEMPLAGRFPYDASKSCADLLSYSYFKTYNLPVCTTRCGNIFGPGDLHFSRIVPDAIRSIIKNKQLIIRSDGTFTRDYIYVEDIIWGYILLAQNMERLNIYGESFNFSNEKPVSVIELFQEITKAAAKKGLLPKILNQAKYEIKNQYLDSKKAKRILGWRPKYTLVEGLKKTISWYINYLHKEK